MRLDLLRRERTQARIVGRDIKHADARAVLRRCELDAALGRLAGGTIDRGGCGPGVPNLEEQRSVTPTDALHARYRAILLDDGSPALVVAGDDSAYRFLFHRL